MNQNFDPFVIPFSAGLLFLFFVLIYKYTLIIRQLSAEDRKKAKKGLFSWKIYPAAGEVVMESLLHRKLFRKNIFLGYMHMSFAFWLVYADSIRQPGIKAASPPKHEPALLSHFL